MLNENLSKVRKDRGLTQEALASKLNVVRQTISKWENGTAVPDADTLCKIADALDVSVAELLGETKDKDEMDNASMTRVLAEINEQLAVRNRRTAKVIKVICVIFICSLIMALFLTICGLTLYTTTGEVKTETEEVDDDSATVEIDENGIPVFGQISIDTEWDLQVYFEGLDTTRDQLVEAWGEPIYEDNESASWYVDDEKNFTVYFNESEFACYCEIEFALENH